MPDISLRITALVKTDHNKILFYLETKTDIEIDIRIGGRFIQSNSEKCIKVAMHTRNVLKINQVRIYCKILQFNIKDIITRYSVKYFNVVICSYRNTSGS